MFTLQDLLDLLNTLSLYCTQRPKEIAGRLTGTLMHFAFTFLNLCKEMPMRVSTSEKILSCGSH